MSIAIEEEDMKLLLKEHKALEIIKSKQVQVAWLLNCSNREKYNDIVYKNRQLTQEEYDLLKEVLL